MTGRRKAGEEVKRDSHTANTIPGELWPGPGGVLQAVSHWRILGVLGMGLTRHLLCAWPLARDGISCRMFHNLFIHLPVVEHLHYFQMMVINRAAMNISVCVNVGFNVS